MPITLTGTRCARRGCTRPEWKDALCARCWRLGHMFGKDPRLFALEPLDGWAGPQDAPELPWDRAGIELFGEPPPAGSP